MVASLADDAPTLKQHWINVSDLQQPLCKHDTLTQCWINAGPTSWTADQH